MTTLLDVKCLSTEFQTAHGAIRPVDDVSIRIEDGESVGLVGESGCGKSMTALSIMRLVPEPGRVVGGQILVEGRDLLTMSGEELRGLRGNQISMIFQEPASYLDPVMRVGDQVGEAIKVHRKVEDKDRVDEIAHTALAWAGLSQPEEVALRYPHELSGGMQQRVMIAIALACRPGLLIADEPTTALDVTIQAQILELIRSLRERLGMAILLITHDLGVVAQFCDRLYVMYAGRVVEEARVHDFFAGPAHPYSRGLLESVIKGSESRKDLFSMSGTVPSLTDLPVGCRFHPRCPYVRPDPCVVHEPDLLRVPDSGAAACHFAEEVRAEELEPSRQ